MERFTRVTAGQELSDRCELWREVIGPKGSLPEAYRGAGGVGVAVMLRLGHTQDLKKKSLLHINAWVAW